MSIEQTNQLILLILNSVLMLLVSTALLGGAWLRQTMLSQQLHQHQIRYRTMAQGFERLMQPPAKEPKTISETISAKANLKKIRSDRQRLSRQYLWSHMGLLLLHGAVLIFSVSLLSLAL
ncbi:MAG: hypothetical protein WBA76_06530 [Phormidesmis sp.]